MALNWKIVYTVKSSNKTESKEWKISHHIVNENRPKFLQYLKVLTYQK